MGVFKEVVRDSLNRVGSVNSAFRERGPLGGVAQLGANNLQDFNQGAVNIGRSYTPGINETSRALFGENAPQIGGQGVQENTVPGLSINPTENRGRSRPVQQETIPELGFNSPANSGVGFGDVANEFFKDGLNKASNVSNAFRDRGALGALAQLGVGAFQDFSQVGENFGRSITPVINTASRNLLGKAAPQIGQQSTPVINPVQQVQTQPVAPVTNGQIQNNFQSGNQPGTIVGLKNGADAGARNIPSLSTTNQPAQAFPDATIAAGPGVNNSTVDFGEGNFVGGLNDQQAQRIQQSLQQGRTPNTFNTDNFVSAQRWQLISDLAQMAKNGEITPQDALNRIRKVEAGPQLEQQQAAQQQRQQNIDNLAQAGDTRGQLAAQAAAGDKTAIKALGDFDKKNGQFVPAFTDELFEKKLEGTGLGTKAELQKLKFVVPKLVFDEASTAIANLNGQTVINGQEVDGAAEIDKIVQELMNISGVPNEDLFRTLLDLDLKPQPTT